MVEVKEKKESRKIRILSNSTFTLIRDSIVVYKRELIAGEELFLDLKMKEDFDGKNVSKHIFGNLINNNQAEEITNG